MTKRRPIGWTCTGIALVLLFTMFLVASCGTQTANTPVISTTLTTTPTVNTQLTGYAVTHIAISSTARATNKLTYDASISAYQRWKASNISNYTIIVTDTTFMRNMKLTVVVRRGRVVQGENVYSIENLFQRLMYKESVGQRYECSQTASFDSQYGFPNIINLNCPAIADGFGTISVISFRADLTNEVF